MRTAAATTSINRQLSCYVEGMTKQKTVGEWICANKDGR
jgi:hypothetical protein